MPTTQIDSAVTTNIKNTLVEFSVAPQQTDGVSDQKENPWGPNERWGDYLGYFEDIPELKAAINAKATWTVGKGFQADEITTAILDTIKGFGYDTFNTILENMIRTYNIGGDAYCEIIRDDEENLINLKPLDPRYMRHIASKQGKIIRFEKTDQIINGKVATFDPEKIFYLPRNRVADQIHGSSIIKSVEKIILMRNEAMEDMRLLMHRHVFPQVIWHVDTDDPAEITKFKALVDNAVKDRENVIIPKGTVEREIGSIPPNATLNPLPWIAELNNYFFQACGVPQIIVGGSREFTEATAKIAYLAFQQSIEEEQLFIEEEVLSQLNLVINLVFPASLENELLSDKAKDGELKATIPSDLTAGRGQ